MVSHLLSGLAVQMLGLSEHGGLLEKNLRGLLEKNLRDRALLYCPHHRRACQPRLRKQLDAETCRVRLRFLPLTLALPR